MKFVSTRGKADECAFVDVIFGGLAGDGGLWIPETMPKPGKLPAGFSFPDLVAAMIAPFTGSAFGQNALTTIAHRACSPDRYPHPAIAPLTQIGPETWLLELFHGPSLAFKDFALQMIGAVWDEWLGTRVQRVTAIVATSGDTGGAAAAALAGKRNIDLVILHPKGRISEVQRRFMTGLGAGNILNLAIEADFDACQAQVKSLLSDSDVAAGAGPHASAPGGGVQFSAVNSINWLRIATQAAYFHWVGHVLDRPFEVIVPTGNFGNALSALLAKHMGAPLTKIVAACNENDFVFRLLETGYLRRETSRATFAPAMDIQVPSNLERALYWAMGEDAAELASLYSTFEQTGEARIPTAAQNWMRTHFSASRASDEEILTAMAEIHHSAGMMLCPHSAAGLVGAQKTGRDRISEARVVLATAHPAKFPDTVARATGSTPPVPARAAAILGAQEHMIVVDNDAKSIRTAIRAFVGRERS